MPHALPEIIVGIRMGLSITLIGLIVSEMILGGKYGLGKRIFELGMLYHTADMYATIFVVGFLGYMFNKLFVHLEHKVVHWRGY